jgi:hypothetical protein
MGYPACGMRKAQCGRPRAKAKTSSSTTVTQLLKMVSASG